MTALYGAAIVLIYILNVKAMRRSGAQHRTAFGGIAQERDDAACWDSLHAWFSMRRINDSVAFMDEDAYTNQAESFFSRLRRAEIGNHHYASGRYLLSYACGMARREDYRRVPNRAQYLSTVGAALAQPVSREWKGVFGAEHFMNKSRCIL